MSNIYDRILITGGGGMLAKAVIAALQARGHQPVMLDRNALDVTDWRSVQSAFDHYLPKLVLNCAAFTKVDLCEDESDRAHAVNVQGVENLSHAALINCSGQLVHFSTDFVFDGRASRPYRED